MQDACKIANLPLLRLVNDTTAIAINYGIYKPNLPEGEAAPLRAMFIDMGESHFSVAIVHFWNDRMKVVASASDEALSGREFDVALAKHFAAEFLVSISSFGFTTYLTHLSNSRKRRRLTWDNTPSLGTDFWLNALALKWCSIPTQLLLSMLSVFIMKWISLGSLPERSTTNWSNPCATEPSPLLTPPWPKLVRSACGDCWNYSHPSLLLRLQG